MAPAQVAEAAMSQLASAALLSRVVLRQVAGELNPTTVSILTALCDRPHRLSELVTNEQLAQPTLTSAVSALERRGWVIRHRDDADRRVVWVTITSAGRVRKRRLHHDAGKLLRAALDELSAAEVAAIVAAAPAMEHLASACTAAEPRAASPEGATR